MREAWAKRDERLFAQAFARVAGEPDYIDEEWTQLSADGRSIVVNAARGVAVVDASSAEPRFWLQADTADELVGGFFVQGRPDDVVFWHQRDRNEAKSGTCLVVSGATGDEKLRIPRCNLPYHWLGEDQPRALPALLAQSGEGACDDDTVWRWAVAGEAPIALGPVQRTNALLSYPWGQCREAPGNLQPLLRELQPGTGVGIQHISASADGKGVAVVFSGWLVTTVGLLDASGRWLSFVRGEPAFPRTPSYPVFSPNGRWLALKSAMPDPIDSEYRILILDAASGAIRHDFVGPCKSAKHLAWSSDSKLLAVGDEERSCVFEMGKGLLWTHVFSHLGDKCFRCEKPIGFALNERVVLVESSAESPGGGAFEARSGRALTTATSAGSFQEVGGELRAHVYRADASPEVVSIDAKLKTRVRRMSAAEIERLETYSPPASPIAERLAGKLCVRAGYVFPSRFCRGGTGR